MKWRHLVGSAMFAGLAFNSYTPGRIFFLLPLGFLILKTIQQYSHIAIKQLLYFLIPLVILIIPLQSYLFTHEDTRVKQLSFFSNKKLTGQTKLGFVAENIRKTTSMFFFQGDPNGKHNYPYKPSLNPILGLFFIGGIGIALKNAKKNMYSLFFILYTLFSILPTLLVYPWENPSMLRVYTILPAVAYFVGLPFTVFKKKKPIVGILILLLILSSIYELRTYFKYQSLVSIHAFEVNLPLKKAITCNNLFDCYP